MRTPTLLALPLATAAAIAQQSDTLPAAASAVDGNSSFLMAGFSSDARQQILIDAALADPTLLGRALHTIAFRRDAGWTAPLEGGAADLTITIAPSPRSAASASPTFDANLDPNPAARTIVFQGRITIPHSPDATGRTITWSSVEDVVEIPLATPYLHTGGNVCIDIVGRQVPGAASRFWAIDAVHDPASGIAVRRGAACGSTKRATINPFTLAPGFSASFAGDGAIGVAAVFLLGSAIPPIDLAAFGLGAPGCELRVAPWISIPTCFEDHAAQGLLEGAATVDLQIPSDPGVLAMPFACQFLTATLPIETTNSLECTIAGSMPSLGMSSVRAPIHGSAIPSIGRVWSTRAPVLRLDSR